MERDSWIEMLVRQVDPDTTPQFALQPPPPPASANPGGLGRRRSQTRKTSKDVVVTAAQPLVNFGSSAADSKFGGAPSPSMINSMESKRVEGAQMEELRTHSTTPPAMPPSMLSPSPNDGSSIGLTAPRSPQPPSRAAKRSSIAPPPPRASITPAYLTSLSAQGLSVLPGHERESDRKAKSGRFWSSPFSKAPQQATRPVFGIPLDQSLAISSIANLPSIVFRCIEWLETHRAEEEEGIYRLSGSSAVIKGLKDRFDLHGDVNLAAPNMDEQWDPHAVAGLLKAYLRELPTSLLTRELHAQFLAVMGESCSLELHEADPQT